MTKNFEFDPVKRERGGKEAEAVVWSVSVLDKAIEAMKKGLPLKANPFIGKNTKLLKPDLVFKRTQEEIDDYIHCMEDPLYFASKCYLMTPTGLKPVVLRDYQEDYLRHLQDNRLSIFLSCRQSGKCLIFTTLCEIIENNCKIKIPFFELYNKYCDQTLIWKSKYFIYKRIYNKSKFSSIYKRILSLLDKIDNKDNDKKILHGFEIKDKVYIKTDTGYSSISNIYMTKQFDVWYLETETGLSLECADSHILFNENYCPIFVKDLKLDDYIQTINGVEKIVNIYKKNYSECMCDITVNDNNHRFYSNSILSHNSTTTAIFCLWTILFRNDRNALILSKSGPAGVDLIKKIKDMYLYLPYHLKLGTLKWNQSEIAFDNNSTITTEAFSPTAGLGKTINFLILDEFAWCPPNDVELFYNNIVPTVTADTNSNICIMSTQNGFNLFYKLWHAAETKKSIYAPFKVDWWQVPQWDKDRQIWIKRDENWKNIMVGVLGSEEAFYYQYGTQFSASDKCLISRETLGKIRDMVYLFNNPDDDSWYFSLHKNELKFKANYDLRDMKNRWYVITVDLAEGGGNDYTTFNFFEVIGKDKFEQVGYWHCNTVDLEQAALEFWVLFGQLFNPDQTIVSVEWNTYGALFYTYLKNLNEPDYMPEAAWRWQVNPLQEFDLGCLAKYKKGSQEDNIANLNGFKNSKTVPGVRLSHATKISACALLKMMIERFDIIMTDLLTVSELENFEDKNGNGSYAASYGHDDLIMTFVQLPLIKNTTKYKDFMEEWEAMMRVTGRWQEFENEEKTQQKIESLKKIAEALGQVLINRKATSAPQIVNIPNTTQVNITPYSQTPQCQNGPMRRFDRVLEPSYDEGTIYDMPNPYAISGLPNYSQPDYYSQGYPQDNIISNRFRRFN